VDSYTVIQIAHSEAVRLNKTLLLHTHQEDKSPVFSFRTGHTALPLGHFVRNAPARLCVRVYCGLSLTVLRILQNANTIVKAVACSQDMLRDFLCSNVLAFFRATELTRLFNYSPFSSRLRLYIFLFIYLCQSHLNPIPKYKTDSISTSYTVASVQPSTKVQYNGVCYYFN
jgi:hypothetical protein